MKKLVAVTALFAVAILFLVSLAPAVSAGEGETVIKVKGMMCSACEAKVKQALKSVKGVKSVEANFRTGEARVILASDKVDEEALQEAVKKAGFRVISIQPESREDKIVRTLKIKGMMCSSCENKVKEALLKVDGVESAQADYKTGEVRVSLSSGAVNVKKLESAVKAAGFEPIAVQDLKGETKIRTRNKKH